MLSPSTESKDRRVKMPIYARYAVGFVWLVDTLSQMLEAYVLEEGDWELLGLAAARRGSRCLPLRLCQ